MSCPSVCLVANQEERGLGGERGVGRGSMSLENAVLVRNVQIRLLGEDIWGKSCIFKITWCCGYSKCLS